jgi:hypothetical protein
MIGLIVSLVGGVLAGVLTLALGGSGSLALVVGVVGAIGVFVLLFALTAGMIARTSASLPVLFPSPPADDRSSDSAR